MPIRDRSIRNTTPTVTGKKGRSGNPGVPSVQSIKHRIDGRQKAERARQQGKLTHHGQKPFRAPGRVDVDDEGVDATHLCGIMELGSTAIPSRCRWIHGEPSADAEFCGKPTKDGSSWCPEHHARVYPDRT